MTDDLLLVVAGRQIAGWTAIRVSRGVERLPSDFSVEMTERFPGEASAYVVRPGDACQVYLGSDLVITGYVDRLMPSISAGRHSIGVAGRGKCEDLVDCAAIWNGGQISNDDALGIAQKLAKPYGITVKSLAGRGKVVPQYNIPWGATVYETVELVCRWSGLLAYDAPDGNLVLAQAGAERHASGLVQGVNVQKAAAMYGMDQRYKEVVVRRLSIDMYQDVGLGGDILEVVEDPGVPRPRTRYIFVEAGDDLDANTSKRRGLWEVGRRYGRSNQLRVTVDGWRDAAGILWSPNKLVDVDIPAVHAAAGPSQQWAIADVTYIRDEQGTRAELLLMPPDAFAPEPSIAPWERSLADIPPPPGGAAR